VKDKDAVFLFQDGRADLGQDHGGVRITSPAMQTSGAAAAPGRLAGKRALLTGGASGIGRATALLFAREGAAIVLFDRDAAGGRAAADEASAAGGRAFFVEGDVTRVADCERAVAESLRLLGGLDVLFNNAGVIRRGTILETSEEDFDRTLAVNV
jgi:NAD(P)-dependent dehydrogenase (short-subunit alcohol dehydrogenase family)